MSLWGRHKRQKLYEQAEDSDAVYARVSEVGRAAGESEECATFSCARCTTDGCTCVCHG